MEKNLIIFIGHLEGPLLEVRDQLKADEEIEAVELLESQIKDNLSSSHFPCAVISNEVKLSANFLNRYNKVLSSTNSKMIVVPIEELEEKKSKQLFGLGAFDVIEGKENNAKSIRHKINLAIKTVPKLEEGMFDNLKMERLISTDKPAEEIKKRIEIDYEVVDYFAVEKMCIQALKNLNKIEESLESYENSGLQVPLKESKTFFEEIIDVTRVNNFTPLETFAKIPILVIDVITQTKDEAFRDVVTGLLFNSVDLLRYEFQSIKDKKLKTMLLENPHKGVYGRFRWVGQRLVDLNLADEISPVMDELGL